MHDANSDGSCASASGMRVPCPLFRTVEAAARAGLDFIAVTDHNTVSQFGGLRELQPYFDRTLLIPGTEITTFHGHANAIGQQRFLDFRVGTPDVPDIAALERDVARAGAILTINHPNLPSGETCMGCGWTWPVQDYAGITAVEAVNGSVAEGPYAGIGFWYARLNEGHRLTGVGGSDNHDPDPDPNKAPVGPRTAATIMTGFREVPWTTLVEWSRLEPTGRGRGWVRGRPGRSSSRSWLMRVPIPGSRCC
jgi:hypothetical protein